MADHLLGDRRRADRPLTVAEANDIGHRRAEDGAGIDAVMRVEVAILGSQKGLDHYPRNLADRHGNAVLALEFGHEAAVAGIDLGASGRLVFGELLVIRQLAPEMRQGDADKAADPERGDDEENEDETRDPAQSPQHQRRSAAAVSGLSCRRARCRIGVGSDTALSHPMPASVSTIRTAAEAKWSRGFLANRAIRWPPSTAVSPTDRAGAARHRARCRDERSAGRRG